MFFMYFFFVSLAISLLAVVFFWKTKYQNPFYSILKWINLAFLIFLILYTVFKGQLPAQVGEDIIESFVVISYMLLIPNIIGIGFKLLQKLKLT